MSVYTNTSQVGIYTVSVDDQSVGRFAVNLLNASESSLIKKQPPKQKVLEEKTTQEQMVYVEVWRATALFSLFLLVFEWIVYYYTGKQN